MKKKVIDIIFPRPHKPLKLEISGGKKSSDLSKKKNKYLIFFIFVLILIGGFYSYFILPKVEIEIWPKTEKLNFETEIKIRKGINEPDFLTRIIPAKVLEAEKIISQQFSATEKFTKENRAEGIIRIYNNHSTEPITLIARTRFISADGHLFRTLNRVIIPGKRREAGRLVPGTLDVKVVADRPGKQYNIGPTSFVLPGFQGRPIFFAVVGRSYQPMTGGVIEEITRISESDLKIAESILNAKKADVCLNILKNEILSERFSFLKEAVRVEVLEKIPGANVGAEVEKFDFGMKLNCRVLAFQTKDVENFVKDFITKQIPENKTIVPMSIKTDKSFIRQTRDKEEVIFSLKITFNIYSTIDHSYLQRAIAGKSLTEIQTFLKNLPQVERFYINFWPFWVKSAPENLDRIKIELQFID